MSDTKTQGYANHRRYIVRFHFVLFAIILVNLVWAIVALARSFSLAGVHTLLGPTALLLLFLSTRSFATANQDRIIRLEMRLRLHQVLPPDLRGRINELPTRQLIALRFASDAEMTALVRRALDERPEPDVIKRAITKWQPDVHRV